MTLENKDESVSLKAMLLVASKGEEYYGAWNLIQYNLDQMTIRMMQ
jgi:hypothetical protein